MSLYETIIFAKKPHRYVKAYVIDDEAHGRRYSVVAGSRWQAFQLLKKFFRLRPRLAKPDDLRRLARRKFY